MDQRELPSRMLKFECDITVRTALSPDKAKGVIQAVTCSY